MLEIVPFFDDDDDEKGFFAAASSPVQFGLVRKAELYWS